MTTFTPARLPVRTGHGAPSVVALAVAEARLFVRHPLFLMGVALTVAMLAGSTVASTALPILFRDGAELAFSFFPLVGATVLVANLAITREPRSDTAESEASLSLPPARRTAGFLLSALAPFLVAVGLVALWIVLAKLAGGVGWPRAAEVLTGPVLVANGAVFGTLLGRWLRSNLVAVVVLLVLAAYHSVVLGWDSPSGPEGWFGLMVALGGEPIELLHRPAPAHLVYLTGVGLVLAGVTYLRDAGARGVRVIVTGLVIAAAGGYVQSRPVSDPVLSGWEAFLAAPETVQACDDRAGVRYCTYPGYGQLIDDWQTPIGGVLERVPDTPRPFEVVQRTSTPLARAGFVPPADQVLRIGQGEERLGRWGDDGALHPDLDWGRGAGLGADQLSLALGAANVQLGLPVGAREFDGRAGACWSGGQARAVVAMWLAATATPHTEQAFRSVRQEIEDYGGYTMGEVHQMSGAVHWSKEDIAVVLAMLDQPHDVIHHELTGGWDRWSSPQTATTELVSALGIAPVRMDDPSGTPYAVNGLENEGRPVTDCT